MVWMEWRPVGWSMCLPLLVFHLHNKVQKFSPGTDSPRRSRKKVHKMVLVWWLLIDFLYSVMNRIVCSLIRHMTTSRRGQRKRLHLTAPSTSRPAVGPTRPPWMLSMKKIVSLLGHRATPLPNPYDSAAHYYSQSKLMHSSSSDCCASLTFYCSGFMLLEDLLVKA